MIEQRKRVAGSQGRQVAVAVHAAAKTRLKHRRRGGCSSWFRCRVDRRTALAALDLAPPSALSADSIMSGRTLRRGMTSFRVFYDSVSSSSCTISRTALP